jgi:purine-binding chemotaxis protein CheW
MKDSLGASKNVMKNYLSELLTDDIDEPVALGIKEQKLDKLLQNVAQKTIQSQPNAEVTAKDKAKPAAQVSAKRIIRPAPTPAAKQPPVKPMIAKPVAKPVLKQAPTKPVVATVETPKVETKLTSLKQQAKPVVRPERAYRKGSFQALFFEVAGLVVAVPLIELGGIHNAEKTSNIVGKPDWFRGVMLHREQQINVVDTALWVMPEKCDETLMNSLKYQYIVMLSNSRWGLSAENLVDTVTLEQDDVKWLDAPSKRPWLAGLVKERMCALLDVEALIKLLDDGAGIFQN